MMAILLSYYTLEKFVSLIKSLSFSFYILPQTISPLTDLLAFT